MGFPSQTRLAPDQTGRICRECCSFGSRTVFCRTRTCRTQGRRTCDRGRTSQTRETCCSERSQEQEIQERNELVQDFSQTLVLRVQAVAPGYYSLHHRMVSHGGYPLMHRQEEPREAKSFQETDQDQIRVFWSRHSRIRGP